MPLNVHFRWGHRMIGKEDSFTGQSQGPAKKRNKGVPPEEQNPGLPGEQIKELNPQPVSEVSSISGSARIDDCCTRETFHVFELIKASS